MSEFLCGAGGVDGILLMCAWCSVRNKMEKGDGMSFAEFTYPLLQAWDWWHMFSTMDVQIQVGGSDQYGNIIAGIDAVKFIAQNHQGDDRGGERPHWLDEQGRLREDATPMGLTVSLLTTSSGEKFGKSAGNAVWLDPSMTSPFDLYGVRPPIDPLTSPTHSPNRNTVSPPHPGRRHSALPQPPNLPAPPPNLHHPARTLLQPQ